MIGYYAHQHGSGHCRFADLFSRNFEQKVNIFTSVDYNFHKPDNLCLLADENPDVVPAVFFLVSKGLAIFEIGVVVS